MQVRMSKQLPDVLFFKTSHCSTRFDKLTIGTSRSLRSSQSKRPPPGPATPPPLYSSRPKIPSGKYGDLLALCTGAHPVISQVEVVDLNLAHE